MQQEVATAQEVISTRFDGMAISEIAEELERWLRIYYEKHRPGLPLRVKALKASLKIYYGLPGYRMKLNREEALRVLYILTEYLHFDPAKQIQEEIAANA